MYQTNTLKQYGMILIEFILFIGILAIIYGIFAAGFSLISFTDQVSVEGPMIGDPYLVLLVDYIPWLTGSILSLLIVHQLIFQRSLSFSGIGKRFIISQFTKGMLWSGLVIGVGFGALYYLGWIQIEKIHFDLYLFSGFILFFLVQSAVEELMIRSFLLSTIAQRVGIWKGIYLSSLVFTLLHVDNPNVEYLSLINIFLAGILLGIVYIRYRQIWAPIGLHTGWNFLQGSFFGFEVSGVKVYSYIDSHETGPDLATGGAFGFEGSILATVMIIALAFWIWHEAPQQFKGVYLHSSLNIN